jgi:hypothetical protein
MTHPQCTICQHERRHQIEVGLVHHVPLSVLAKRFDCSKDALHRHRHNHLSPQVAAAILANRKPSEIDLEQLQASEAEGLLSQLVVQRARLQTYAEASLDMGDTKAAVAVERCIVSNLELTAKLLGQLIQHHDVRHTSILVSPDYLELRGAIVSALRPFPQAAKAVGQALHALEAKAANEISEKAQPKLIEAIAQ